MIRRLASALAVTALLGAPSTAGATITIGSDLTGPNSLGFGCLGQPRCTAAQTSPAGKYVSPVNGTINYWRVKIATAGGDPLNLRVIRHGLGYSGFDGAGTSNTVISTASGGGMIEGFPTQLPIKMGDRIGIDAFQDTVNMASASADPAMLLSNWAPPLVNGAGDRDPDSGYFAELLLNADVVPDNALVLGKTTSLKNGAVSLEVQVPNPGTLKVGDVNDPAVAASAAAKPLLNPFSLNTVVAGKVPLTLLPTKAAKKRLKKKGKARASVQLLFTPMGGTTSALTTTVRLKKKKKRRKKK